MYYQYTLTHGTTVRTGWIDYPRAMSPGTQLTLKGDDRIWTVTHAGKTAITQPPDTSWQVGGMQGRLTL